SMLSQPTHPTHATHPSNTLYAGQTMNTQYNSMPRQFTSSSSQIHAMQHAHHNSSYSGQHIPASTDSEQFSQPNQLQKEMKAMQEKLSNIEELWKKVNLEQGQQVNPTMENLNHMIHAQQGAGQKSAAPTVKNTPDSQQSAHHQQVNQTDYLTDNFSICFNCDNQKINNQETFAPIFNNNKKVHKCKFCNQSSIVTIYKDFDICVYNKRENKKILCKIYEKFQNELPHGVGGIKEAFNDNQQNIQKNTDFTENQKEMFNHFNSSFYTNYMKDANEKSNLAKKSDQYNLLNHEVKFSHYKPQIMQKAHLNAFNLMKTGHASQNIYQVPPSGGSQKLDLKQAINQVIKENKVCDTINIVTWVNNAQYNDIVLKGSFKSNTPIGSILEKIKQHEHIKENLSNLSFNLSHNGNPLEDEKTFADYNIPIAATITLTLALKYINPFA
ncbi:MAG: hypothetical protein AAF380_02925, partial [Bacteroidota bacterium]